MIDAAGSTPDKTRFESARTHLAGLDADAAGVLLSAAADVSLIIDSEGVIIDVSFGDADLAKTASRDWVGKRWIDTVSVETRQKVAEILSEAKPRQATRWRHVNQLAAGGSEIPIRYCAIRIGSDRRIVAVGRDLRALANLQLRLADAQQAMEREYARVRNVEKRYRLLFQLSAEPVVIVDAASQKIVEVNPAASAMFGAEARRLPGGAFSDLFGAASRQAVQSFVAAARLAPRVDNVLVELAQTHERVMISGSLYRQENISHILVLLARMDGSAAPDSKRQAALQKIVEEIPEAFVILDSSRRITRANAAFVDLVQIGDEAHVRGEPIDRWIGRPDVDADVIFTNLKTHGSIRQYSTVARGELGGSEDIEIVGAAVRDAAETLYGLLIRTVSRRSGPERLGGRELPRTVENFTDLVGRVPLKNLVRETTDLIERLCIEAALQLTEDNRASAAEMLGLSRQGFYAKLRRYGLGDLGDATDERDKA